jgi:hypothetical protein
MRGQEGVVFCANAAAGTYGLTAQAAPPYASGMQGGSYLLLVSCTGTPSAQLQTQDPSGNWINVGTAITTSGGGSEVVQLPPGTVRVVISTSTANYASMARIPTD